jgi:heme/copper-type cytochrome/quinol oxidase subunit 2
MNPALRISRSWLALIALATLFLATRVLGAEHETAHAAASLEKVHAAADAHIHDAEVVGTFSLKQIAHSYLTAYMFCLSLCFGSLFLSLAHHLFDAGWSASIRRVTDTIASLLYPWMVLLVLPILAFAWNGDIYNWFKMDPATDHALDVKKVLFNRPTFTVLVPAIIALLGLIANQIRNWSIAQDKDGAAKWTSKSRKLAAGGIFLFAFGMTLVCFYLMKSLQHQFFSTMYGVFYFAGSVWTTLITLYILTMYLSQPGKPLEKVYFKRQQQDLGVLFFAFTVFYAYIHFSQYFLIWNAAIPEETFWYVLREKGSWKWVGMTILFGHFFVPFLLLLNQDIKRNLAVMVPVAIWAWLMHYVDMTFNIMPVIHPAGLHLTLWDPLLWAGLVAIIGFLFWRKYQTAAPYPLRDPRLKEAVTHHEVPAPGAAAAH